MRVPGPPRGRSRAGSSTPAELVDRVQAMRDAERARGGVPLLRFVRDVILLLKDLAADPRVPRRDRLVAGLAAGYLVSPVDAVVDKVPVLGQVDDVLVALLAARRLLAAAGYAAIYELWRGSDEGFALVLALTGVHE